jgi:hypothetical protein
MAIGVAAGGSAAALGLGYGLGVITWVPASQTDSVGVWYASLTWVTWLAATATLVGALVAGQLSPHPGADRLSDTARRQAGAARPWEAAWWAVIALAASIGALITVPLVAIPARVARQVNNAAPQFTAGGYAAAGVILGLVTAFAALAVRAVAANLVVSAAYIWVMAVMAAVDGLESGRGPAGAQLGTWRFASGAWLRDIVNLPAAVLMLILALLVGAAAAWPAARRGDNRIGVALSGASGPLLVAAAYFLTTPGVDDRSTQLSAYVIAPYAVLAGVAGSVLVSLVRPAAGRRRVGVPGDTTGGGAPAASNGGPVGQRPGTPPGAPPSPTWGVPPSATPSAHPGGTPGGGQPGVRAGARAAATVPAPTPAGTSSPDPDASRRVGVSQPDNHETTDRLPG